MTTLHMETTKIKGKKSRNVKWTHNKVRTSPTKFLMINHGAVNGVKNTCSKNTSVYSCKKNTIRQILGKMPSITGLQSGLKEKNFFNN